LSRASQVQGEDYQGWNDHKSEMGHSTATEQSAISQVHKGLKAMTLEEKNELTSKMGVREDFTLA
jgi:hypothetical protein